MYYSTRVKNLCPKFVVVIKCCGGEDGCTPSLGNYGQRRAAILIPWMAGKMAPILQDSQWLATSVTHVGAESLLAAFGMMENLALRFCDLIINLCERRRSSPPSASLPDGQRGHSRQ